MPASRIVLLVVAIALQSPLTVAQTTSGTSATIVVPIIAQTGSFASEVTVYNPNAAAITVQPAFYDAQNTASPGLKNCNLLLVSAGRSVQFALAAQCALPAGGHFGLLLLTEQSGSQRFYGHARTQTPQGVGFSTEGFPIENFNDQLQHATGVKRVAASAGQPAYTTNCFVTALGDAVSYELRLYASWNFKGADPKNRLLGPIAQDFHAAFGLGDDLTIINTNLHGVAYAAIQGLHQLVQKQNERFDQLAQENDTRIAALEQRLSELETIKHELATLSSVITELQRGRQALAAR